MIGRKSLQDLAGRCVHNRESIADILDDINQFSIRRKDQSRRIARARAVRGFCLRQFVLVLKGGHAVFP